MRRVEPLQAVRDHGLERAALRCREPHRQRHLVGRVEGLEPHVAVSAVLDAHAVGIDQDSLHREAPRHGLPEGLDATDGSLEVAPGRFLLLELPLEVHHHAPGGLLASYRPLTLLGQ